MSGFSINYHDSESEWAAKEAGPIIFMNRARVEALGFALIAAERITEVNAAAANQKESSETAQSAAE